jgi:hypothetical protein
MRDPLRDFDWSSLYERYDAMCRRFNPAAVHLRIFTPKPQSDRELYYHLVERIRMTNERPSGLSIDLYEALLYWKLYSNPPALANVRHWLDSGARVAQSANLKRLLDGCRVRLTGTTRALYTW